MRKPNKSGCIPTEDVCLQHSSPRVCRHGCLLSTCECSELREAKLQARLEAAELAMEMAAGFTDRLYRKDFFVAYDNWRQIKEAK